MSVVPTAGRGQSPLCPPFRGFGRAGIPNAPRPHPAKTLAKQGGLVSRGRGNGGIPGLDPCMAARPAGSVRFRRLARQAGQRQGREPSAAMRLDGDQETTNPDDGDAGDYSGTYIGAEARTNERTRAWLFAHRQSSVWV